MLVIRWALGIFMGVAVLGIAVGSFGGFPTFGGGEGETGTPRNFQSPDRGAGDHAAADDVRGAHPQPSMSPRGGTCTAVEHSITLALEGKLRPGVHLEDLAATQYPDDLGEQWLSYVSAEVTLGGRHSVATWIVDESGRQIFSANRAAQQASHWPAAPEADPVGVGLSQDCVA